MEKFRALQQLVADAEKDAQAFYEKGNKTAGTRFRKALQDIKASATALRKDVTEKKTAGK